MEIFILYKYFLQWLFIRLTYCEQEEEYYYRCSWRTTKIRYKYWYSLQYFILPTTGWKTDFKFIFNKPLITNITKDKYYEKILY